MNNKIIIEVDCKLSIVKKKRNNDKSFIINFRNMQKMSWRLFEASFINWRGNESSHIFQELFHVHLRITCIFLCLLVRASLLNEINCYIVLP